MAETVDASAPDRTAGFMLVAQVWRGDAAGGAFRDYKVPARPRQSVFQSSHKCHKRQALLNLGWNGGRVH